MVILGLKKVRGKATKRRGTMNGLETQWSKVLDDQMATGAIVRWDFECEKLKLGEGAWYCPDFRVVLNDGTIEFHECKGFMREAAGVRLKVAASLHPYVFKLVKRKNKQWTVEAL